MNTIVPDNFIVQIIFLGIRRVHISIVTSCSLFFVLLGLVFHHYSSKMDGWDTSKTFLKKNTQQNNKKKWNNRFVKLIVIVVTCQSFSKGFFLNSRFLFYYCQYVCMFIRKPKLSKLIKLNDTNVALLLQKATQKY